MNDANTTKDKSNNSPLKYIAVVGGVIVLTAIGWIFLKGGNSKDVKDDKDDKQQSSANPFKNVSKTKTSSKTKSSSVIEVVTEEDDSMSESELSEKIMEIMFAVSQGNINVDEIKKVQNAIDKLDPIHAGVDIRLICAQFYLATYGTYSTEEENPNMSHEESLAHALKILSSDMSESVRSTWALLEYDFEQEQQQRMRDYYRLAMSWRLHDLALMEPAYEKVLERSTLDDDEIQLAFGVAPHIGKWQDVKKLGSHLAQKGSLVSFHDLSLQGMTFDYSVIYQMVYNNVFDLSKKPSMTRKSYKVTSFQMKLNSVESEDPDQAEEIRKKYPSDWAILPQSELKMLFYQLGPIAMFINPDHYMNPLTGPFSDKLIKVSGYIDIPTQDATISEENPFSHQRYGETLELSPDPSRENWWVGFSKSRQTKFTKNGTLSTTPSNNIIYDVQLKIEEA